jgi:two-component system sensor histidine kinase MtrB
VRRARAAQLAFRSSLQLRVFASTLAIGLAAISAVGVYVSERTRDGLFDARVAQVLAESSRSTAQAQSTFDSSTATTGADVQQLLWDVTTTQGTGGTSDRGVVLLRAPGEDAPESVASFASDVDLLGAVSADLEEAVARGGQHWQSVELTTSVGARVPGVVVGQSVAVPVVGGYQLYFLYSLQPEQDRLDFLLRTFLVAGAALVLLLGAMTFVVTRQAVRPVVQAALVAERLADGHLDERLQVRGEDEMATLARSFNEMADSLADQIARMAELSTLQRRFVSDVSHELRTPLTTIRIAAEVIHAARDGFDPAVKRSAELMTTQLDRFEDLLADLLEISRFDAGAAMLEAQSHDVREVVRDAAEAAAPLAQRRGSWIAVQLPVERVIADIDPRRVERVLRNLLVNAVEHAEGSPVEVQVAADARAVAVTVRDHGVGMSAGEAEHVFDRFWRADPARARSTGGTGLGLAISAEDARLHGGWLEAWGRPGQGACFRLTLPLRAGLTLTGSPLPLVPVDPPVHAAAARPASGPAALPRLTLATGAVPVVPDPEAGR